MLATKMVDAAESSERKEKDNNGSKTESENTMCILRMFESSNYFSREDQQLKAVDIKSINNAMTPTINVYIYVYYVLERIDYIPLVANETSAS